LNKRNNVLEFWLDDLWRGCGLGCTCCFLLFFVVILVLFFDVDVVFFFIITGFFVSTIRRQSTNIFFSLIFPLFFHFDGPFPLTNRKLLH